MTDKVERCEDCVGDSCVIKGREADGSPIYMTGWEWCQEMNECAATIDWEAILAGTEVRFRIDGTNTLWEQYKVQVF